ncbi:hypothetical protein EMIHUDRAFT_451668, partial [Emiliania huxleyi CCMP1516]|uniref:phosphoribosyl-ATP diphosphatase n=2 Tax=Emiliania huxleyi TaxID=2903 RepID=A0A0D3IWP0_EMIH1
MGVGAWQRLCRVAVDSDGDALRFTVRQYGSPPSFCHRGTLTCWGFPSGLRALQETLQSRRGSAPAGSYTKRLFDDSTLLRSKLVEEAQELAEAEEPDDIASEAADLLFFALVRCVAAGVTLADVEAHLDARALKLARRPGNAKASRDSAAATILSDKAKRAADKGPVAAWSQAPSAGALALAAAAAA